MFKKYKVKPFVHRNTYHLKHHIPTCMWRCVYTDMYIFKTLIISRNEDYEYIFFLFTFLYFLNSVQ